MHYRRFGRTELRMPVLTCGGMRFMQSWKAGDAVTRDSQENVEACVRRAFEVGINHFETARGYGTSEAQLGRVLRQLPRGEILVQTKVAPTADPAEFVRNFADSLQRLGLEYLDLFALHGLNDEQTLGWAVREGGCLERAFEFRRQGRVRHIGFSTHGPTDTIVAAIRDGRFDYVNLHYYYVFQDHRQALEEAARRDLGVLIISPNDKGGKLETPSAKLVELTRPLSPMVYNDLWCLEHPEIHTLSLGVVPPSDFDEHLEAVRHLASGVDLPELLAPIEQRLQAELVRVLGPEWAARWREGLPAWQQMPGQVNVREILRLYTLARAYELIDYGKMRYNLLGNGGHWFPGNKADRLAEVDRQELLRALVGSPFPERVLDALEHAHRLLAGKPLSRLQRQ
jgi:predicted aldo/keto reductase-like oxidoreductase